MKLEIKQLIEQIAKDSHSPVLLIDGPAGAGKTTLALEIAAEHVATILHLDDFYDGWDEPFDDNFIQRVEFALNHLIDLTTQPSFTKFDWHTESFAAATMERTGNLIIIEGVGAGLLSSRLSSGLPSDAHAMIFVEIESAIGVQRVIERDGQHLSNQIQKWKDREDSIFATYDARTLADLTL